MARIGINPARGKTSSYRSSRITIAVLTYIPNLSGYFEHRLEVLKLVFASLFAHTDHSNDPSQSHELMVFDNGSCNNVVSFLLELQESRQIDYLILSPRNIGKINALKIMFSSAPGEIIAYSDDDVFFYPGWLKGHLEIFEHFHQVGMVSGVAVRNASGHAQKSLGNLTSEAIPGLTTYREHRIPDGWEVDWAISTGRNPEEHLKAMQDHQDLIFRLEKPEHNGVLEAIGSANHFQFISPKEVILQALPNEWSNKLMGSMIELDKAVDNLGYLRLSTTTRYTRHLGNILSDEVVKEASSLGLILREEENGESLFTNPSITRRNKSKKHWILQIPGARRILKHTYDRLFEILS